MAMDLSELAEFSTERPPTALPIDWAAVEAWLGLQLPDDYMDLASAYGPVYFGDLIWIHVPCVQQSGFDYGEWLRDTKHLCRLIARDLPPHRPPAFHPTPGGLLPWGSTRTSGHLFWDTSASDDPNQWTVVLFQHLQPSAGRSPWQAYELTMSEFLETLVLDRLPLPDGGFLGPLPMTVAADGRLSAPQPWIASARRQLGAAEADLALGPGTGLASLRALLPPPEAPYLGEGVGWDGLFAELGTRLPREYITLMELYGAGIWGDWLRFHTPLRTQERGFGDHLRQWTSTYRQHRSRFPEQYPLAVWPEPGGLLPFATTIDNDTLGWLTAGEPDEWPLIVCPRHASQGPALEGGLTATLVEWLRGRLSTEGLPGLDPDDDPLEFAVFESWSADSYW